MKNLIIPNRDNRFIGLERISSDFKGLIIGYFNDNPVGFIEYDDGWNFVMSIDFTDSEYSDNLIDIIESLIDRKVCDSFKVIEFA